MLFFPLAPLFMTFLLRHAQKSKFLDKKVLWWSLFTFKVTYMSLGISFFLNFFWAFTFSPFLIFLLQWLTTFYWACFHFKVSLRRANLTMDSLALFTGNLICSEFFCQISEHFRTYFRLHWASHSDLGITGKSFAFCKSWEQMMPILVKDDDFSVKQRPLCLYWPVIAGTGVNGLNSTLQ